MAKKKSKPVYVEPEEETQEVEEDEPVFTTDDDVDAELEEAKSPGKPMSKAKAARAALDAGIESPQDASSYIKREFGIDMTPMHFSAVKSGLKKKEREAEPELPARRGRPATVEAPVSVAPRRASNGDADLLEAMEAMKPLVAALGVDRVQRIVDLLG